MSPLPYTSADLAELVISTSLKRGASAQGEQHAEVDAAQAAGTVSDAAVDKLKQVPAADFNAALLKAKRQKRTDVAFTVCNRNGGVSDAIQQKHASGTISTPTAMAYVQAGVAYEQRLSDKGVSAEIQQKKGSGEISTPTAMGYVRAGVAYEQRLAEEGVSEEIQKMVAEKKILPHQALQHVKYDELVSKEGVSEEIQKMVRSGTICKAAAMQYVREGGLYAAGALTMPAQIQHLLDTRQITQYAARGLARSERSEMSLLQRMAKMANELYANDEAFAALCDRPRAAARSLKTARTPATGIDTSFFGF